MYEKTSLIVLHFVKEKEITRKTFLQYQADNNTDIHNVKTNSN